jgi:hypothetical protein
MAQLLCESHDNLLGRRFGLAKMGLLVYSLNVWVGQDIDVAASVRTCQMCQRVKCLPAFSAPYPSFHWIVGAVLVTSDHDPASSA